MYSLCLHLYDSVYLFVPTESYQFSVPESERVSAVVAKIRAVDLDVGPNADMDYRILDGDSLGTFSIITDSNTQEGLITLHKVLVTSCQTILRATLSYNQVYQMFVMNVYLVIPVYIMYLHNEFRKQRTKVALSRVGLLCWF